MFDFLIRVSFSISLPTLEDLVLDVPLCSQTFGHYLYYAFSKDRLEVADMTAILEPLKEGEELTLLKVLFAFLTHVLEGQVCFRVFRVLIFARALIRRRKLWRAFLGRVLLRMKC